MFSLLKTSVFFLCVALSIAADRFFIRDGMEKYCKGETGLFKSSSCNKFVHCWSGNAVEQECPAGLLFNSKGYCDFPQNVECYEVSPTVSSDTAAKGDSSLWSPPPSVQSTGTMALDHGQVIHPQHFLNQSENSAAGADSFPQQSRLSKGCRKARGQFASTYCDKYINCWDGQAIEEKCPSGLLFSYKGYCDFPQNVNCGERLLGNAIQFHETTQEYQPQGATNVTPTECPLPSGTFRDKTKCNKYFTCIANQVVARQECPQGLFFNDFLGVCDFSSRVDCSKEPVYFHSTRKDDISYNTKIKDPDCLEEFGAFRDINNCSTFYICVSNKLVAKYNCPEGLRFNDDLGICDYSKNVNCWLPPKVFKLRQNFIQTISPELMQKIKTCRVGSHFPLNSQCTAMCLCKDNVAEIVQCPAALAYDTTEDKCVLPHIARC